MVKQKGAPDGKVSVEEQEDGSARINFMYSNIPDMALFEDAMAAALEGEGIQGVHKRQRLRGEAKYGKTRKQLNTFTVQPAWRDLILKACDIGKKAGTAAMTACESAECTQGHHEAHTLVGYCDENIERIGKMVGNTLEIASGGRLAMLTGLRLFLSKLDKLADTEGDLLVDDAGSKQQREMVSRLIRRFNHETPELELDDA